MTNRARPHPIQIEPPLTAMRNRVSFDFARTQGMIKLAAGRCFDLAGDLASFVDPCRSPERLAEAVGMLTALAGKNERTAGFEKAVYIIQVGDDPITKIGISANPLSRTTELQGSHYRQLFLWGVLFCPKRNGFAIEQAVLERANRNGTRLLGEWIADEPDTVFRHVLEVARDGEYPVCDARTWFEDMVIRTKELHRRQRELASALKPMLGKGKLQAMGDAITRLQSE